MALAQRRSVASAHTFPPQSSSSRSKQQRPALPAKAVQRLRTPTTCIHKEYARQGSPTQEAEVSAAGSAVMHSRSGAGGLLSVPGDIVLECLTVLRCEGTTAVALDRQVGNRSGTVQLAGKQPAAAVATHLLHQRLASTAACSRQRHNRDVCMCWTLSLTLSLLGYSLHTPNHHHHHLHLSRFHPPPSLPRRGELSGLQPYLPADRLAPQGAPVMLAGVPVHEQGPLARCAPFMDTAARRVLPGHLLRRARVLSSLQVGPCVTVS